MRENSNKIRIEKFIDEVGLFVKKPVNVYFTGGATAVMLGIRESTIDIDIKFDPDEIQMYEAIKYLKEKLNMNIELASPSDFIPALPSWKERSIFIVQKGSVRFFHYDLYSQVIAKVQRRWKQDLSDVAGFMRNNVDKEKLLELFISIKPAFIKYPSIDAEELEKRLKHWN